MSKQQKKKVVEKVFVNKLFRTEQNKAKRIAKAAKQSEKKANRYATGKIIPRGTARKQKRKGYTK